MSLCMNHLDYAGEACLDCGEMVDRYGNTENQFSYCSFPDCGCDGARLCMAGKASENAECCCVEAMWSMKTQEQKDAVKTLVIAARMGLI